MGRYAIILKNQVSDHVIQIAEATGVSEKTPCYSNLRGRICIFDLDPTTDTTTNYSFRFVGNKEPSFTGFDEDMEADIKDFFTEKYEPKIAKKRVDFIKKLRDIVKKSKLEVWIPPFKETQKNGLIDTSSYEPIDITKLDEELDRVENQHGLVLDRERIRADLDRLATYDGQIEEARKEVFG